MSEEFSMKFVRACIAIAAIAPMAALAAIGPGQYSVGGLQQICLVSGGTWYSTTFPAWGGRWQQVAVGSKLHTHIYGNYAGGVGNDSMVFKGASKGSWTEWRDDLSFQTVLNPVQIDFVKATCDPPALRAQGGSANPAR
jgi:hypothetical protein